MRVTKNSFENELSSLLVLYNRPVRLLSIVGILVPTPLTRSSHKACANIITMSTRTSRQSMREHHVRTSLNRVLSASSNRT